MTPVDKSKWSDFRNWSENSKKWFTKNIPLYELDSMIGLDPLSSSINNYCMSLAKDVEVVPPVNLPSSTTITSPISSTPASQPHDPRGFPFTDADFGTPPGSALDWSLEIGDQEFEDFVPPSFPSPPGYL
jgi:hypothetical protein